MCLLIKGDPVNRIKKNKGLKKLYNYPVLSQYGVFTLLIYREKVNKNRVFARNFFTFLFGIFYFKLMTKVIVFVFIGFLFFM